MVDLHRRIEEIYARKAEHIMPFVGQAFRSPEADQLRVMAVGINAYAHEDHWGRLPPQLYAEWFEKRAYRFQRGLHRDLSLLSAALVQPPFMFGNLAFRGLDSFFVTNAIKVYVREAEGKKAAQLSDSHYESHLGQWHDELDAMASARALPHVIAIIGAPFWKFACATFRGDSWSRELRVKSYRSVQGECLHFANRIVVAGSSGDHELLLVRLRHPAAPRRTGSPKWLLGHADFRSLALSRVQEGACES